MAIFVTFENLSISRILCPFSGRFFPIQQIYNGFRLDKFYLDHDLTFISNFSGSLKLFFKIHFWPLFPINPAFCKLSKHRETKVTFVGYYSSIREGTTGPRNEELVI